MMTFEVKGSSSRASAYKIILTIILMKDQNFYREVEEVEYVFASKLFF